MSTRLGLALHDVADAAAHASAFGDPDDGTTVATVHRLASRVRRRRATRAAGTVTVAASAAGAVVLVGPQLTADLSPAADPDADPGTCRSSVATLPSGADDTLGVDLGFAAADGTETVGGPGNDGGVGTWQADSIDLVVAVSELPAATTDPSRLRFLVTRKEVVVATAQQPVDHAPTPSGQLLAEMYGTDRPPVDDPGTTLHALRGSKTFWTQSLVDGGPGPIAQRTPMGLAACDGSGPLLPGEYDVWVTAVDAAGTAHGAAGPWELTVAPAERRLDARLPDGFPRDVPLIGGRLVAAHPHGAGWAAEVAADGEDRGRVAWDLLADAQAESHDEPVTVPPDPLSGAMPWAGYHVDDWLVDAIPSRTADGEPSVVYVLRPGPDVRP
ncbi:hypothetical protein J1G42_06040 [Cellulomonas sp. zg-ZUI222]|uniref:hypothetical protein n=1 Tax=Cellulomonas TaxID=1707 RepID=UPI001A941017|nr:MULTISPECIES: hypothetical protein [Cellulomonas]MBO0899520.1 hypothetical protein [Cellulomonas sp. zg-ZUI22]MBO0920383.1 hypothetical protein [Cellulomonas wangleii]